MLERQWLFVVIGLLASSCHEGTPEAMPRDEAASLDSRAQPNVAQAPPPGPQDKPDEGAPVIVRDVGAGAASGAGPPGFPGPPQCDGPVYFRVRNVSELNFDSVAVIGIDFGPLRAGAQSEYRRANGCPYSYGQMSVTSGKQRFMIFPIDYVGEARLQPGYYTHALKPVAPDGLDHQISRDPPPK